MKKMALAYAWAAETIGGLLARLFYFDDEQKES